MLPSEEEIRELLANVCRHSVMTDSEWRTTVAHAIAEKLAEGVVWRTEAVVDISEDGVIRIVDPVADIGPILTHREVRDGQLVNVTVTKKEEK